MSTGLAPGSGFRLDSTRAISVGVLASGDWVPVLELVLETVGLSDEVTVVVVVPVSATSVETVAAVGVVDQRLGGRDLLLVVEPDHRLLDVFRTVDLVVAGDRAARALGYEAGRSVVAADPVELALEVTRRATPWALDRRIDADRERLVQRPVRDGGAAAPVSVLIPTYNRVSHLDECLASVLAIDADVSIIISDNASDDGTFELCRDLTAHDERVVLRRNDENLGWLGNCSALLHAATSDLVSFVFSDDRVTVGSIERLAEVLTADPGLALATGPFRIIDDNGIETPAWPESNLGIGADAVLDPRVLGDLMLARHGNLVGPPSGPMLRRSLLELDTPSHIAGTEVFWAFDIAMYLKVLQHGPAAYVVDPVCDFRVGASTQSAELKRAIGMSLDFWWMIDHAPAMGYLHDRADRRAAVANCLQFSRDRIAWATAVLAGGQSAVEGVPAERLRQQIGTLEQCSQAAALELLSL